MKKKVGRKFFVVLGIIGGVVLLCSGGYLLAQVVTDITIAPQTLVLSSKSTSWVTVHTDLPYSAVQSASVSLDDIPIAWSKADSRGYFVAKFQIATIKGFATPPSAELTIEGLLKDGQTFVGTDTVSVIE